MAAKNEVMFAKFSADFFMYIWGVRVFFRTSIQISRNFFSIVPLWLWSNICSFVRFVLLLDQMPIIIDLAFVTRAHFKWRVKKKLLPRKFDEMWYFICTSQWSCARLTVLLHPSLYYFSLVALSHQSSFNFIRSRICLLWKKGSSIYFHAQKRVMSALWRFYPPITNGSQMYEMKIVVGCYCSSLEYTDTEINWK